MQRKTLIALGALVVIAFLAFLTLRSPDKGERRGPKPRPVAAFKAADVKELELSSNNGRDRVSLRREGDRWKITAPGTWDAEQSLIKAALEQLEKLSFGDLVTEQPANFANLEVSDDKGAHVVARGDGGKVLLDAWMGKSVSGFTLLRPTGKNEVWQSTGAFRYTFAKDAQALRDHAIVDVARDDIKRVTLEGGGQKVVLEQVPAAEKNAEATWKVIESTVKIDKLDEQMVSSLGQTLGGLRATSFSDKPLADPAVGLEPPQSKITITTKSGGDRVLRVGKLVGDDGYLALEGRPQVYLVQKWTMERLAPSPMDLRDKTIIKVKDVDIAEVTVAQGAETLVLKQEGSTWKLGRGTGDIDEGKARAVASAFDNLAGSSFAAGLTPAQTGLDKPTAVATLRLKDKAQAVIKVGATKGDEVYVQRVGSPDVLLVKKWSVERFTKKLPDLLKTAAAAAPEPTH